MTSEGLSDDFAPDDEGPECETCGKTTCPDADLPGFSDPVSCAYLPIYNGLRYDRCDYGCGRDITQASIRRDVVPTVDALLAAARNETEHLRDAIEIVLDGLPGYVNTFDGDLQAGARSVQGFVNICLRTALDSASKPPASRPSTEEADG